MSHEQFAAAIIPIGLMTFGAALWLLNWAIGRFMPDNKVKRFLLFRIGR